MTQVASVDHENLTIIGSLGHIVAVGAAPTSLTNAFRALYIGTAGNPVITTVSGDTITLNNLAIGIWHPVAFTQISSLGGATGVLVGR